ncbi:hypothetical protein HPC49_33775 [Pyxidicoccus fallax]|uniref:Tetratricopeptide repeat protein n=1 Tax=Pyxidicoccus fallax TaxID=394095 RepID=A0A848LG55_9BACT|nr:hypothetical protein [Pyxidicoccus fallax]NMO15441.1 hypothetical protein [Pyxidicoccus fallax]NPC83177.1 hypothetical protein [Pyxidicoccus fallax]
MAFGWLKRIFGSREEAKTPQVITLREREVALRIPTQTPLEAQGPRRGSAPTCKDCGTPLVEVLFTTGGPMGDPELWREHPLAVDGWICKTCGMSTLPRFLEPEEVTALGGEGARLAREGRLDEAELNFRRICSSWPGYGPARLDLATLYTLRINEEVFGAGRAHVLKQYADIVERHIRDALRGDSLPSLPAAIKRLVTAHLALDGTAAAEAAIDLGLSYPKATDEDREALGSLREWVRHRGDLYERGTEAIQPYMHIHAETPRPVDAKARRQLEVAVEDLLKYQRLNPESWQALWIAGKGRQALGDPAGAAEIFGRAYAFKRDQPDVAREYALQLLRLQRFAEAEDVARSACEADPSDAGLVANVALAQLLGGRVAEAEATASRALDMSPEDPVTKTLLGRIREARSGRRPAPRTIEDLERGR